MYWAGRYTAVYDEAMSAELSDPLPTSPSSFDAADSEDREEARQLAVFKQLDDHCLTFEAQQSLRVFQTKFAHMQKNPALMPPPPKVAPPSKSLVSRLKEERRKEKAKEAREAREAKEDKEAKGFVKRLMGGFK
jgi:hypothetical protein